MKKSLGYVFVLCSLVTAADQVPQELRNKIPPVPDAVTTVYEQKAVVFDSYRADNIQAEVIGARLVNQVKGRGAAIVITEADIKSIQATTVPDILQNYGFTKYSNATGSSIDTTLTQRGFSRGSDFIVVVDGVRMNELDDNEIYWPLIPIANIEKIDIYPGAQSATYGSGAFASVVSITTKKVPENTVALAAGSSGYGKQALNMGIKRGDFSYRLGYSNEAATGYRHDAEYNLNSFSGNLSWQLPQDLIDISFSSAGAKMAYPDQLTAAELAADRRQTVSPDTRVLSAQTKTLTYVHDFSDELKFSLIGALRDRYNRYHALSRLMGSSEYSHMYENGGEYITQMDYKGLSLGYEYRRADIRSTKSGDPNAYSTKTRYEKTGDLFVTKGEYAPFVQLYGEAGPLYARYGVRHDHVDYVYTDRLKGTYLNNAVFEDRTHSGELGLQFNEQFTLYGQYGEAFRAPNFSHLYSPWGGNPTLTPELAKTVQAGVRTKAEVWSAEWNVFQTIVSDEIMGQYDPATYVDVNQNIGKTKRAGFSLQGQYNVLPEVKLTGLYTYTKARFLEGSYEDYRQVDYWLVFDPTRVDLEGKVVPMIPEQAYTLGVQYQQNSYQAALFYNYIGRQYADSDYQNEMPQLNHYGTVDLKQTYGFTDNFTMTLAILNLTNQLYSTKALASIYKDSLTGKDVREMYYTPADARSFTLGGEYKF